MGSILLITSGQPSANPRLVKEAKVLDQVGYKVKVIYTSLSPWADQFDCELFQSLSQIQFINVGYHPNKNPFKHKWARLRKKIYSSLFKMFGDYLDILDYSYILFGQELLKEALKHKADLYIAHNLGALPIAVKASKLHKSKVGFDAEDFHRGEVSNSLTQFNLIKLIEEKYFKDINYFSASSPLVLKKYRLLFPTINSVLINNVFERKHAALSIHPIQSGEVLKLLWFSQILGKGRGIECAVKALCEELKDELVNLTLLGNCSKEFHSYLEKLVPKDIFNDKIKLEAPVSPIEIFKKAQDFHIGLALEPGRDINNNIALSNKIYTYILAGNALIVTDTDAQAEFMNAHNNIGILCERENPKALAIAIKRYLNDKSLLQQHRSNALSIGLSQLNWETESQKLLTTVSTVLQK